MVVRIIGAGAVGLSVANKLNGHCDLALIVDEERKKRYSAGLKYNGQLLNIRLCTPDEANSTDLLIVAVKNFQLHSAIEEMKPFVGVNTTILPILNGIEAEGVLADVFGEERLLYGFITDLSANHSGLETNCFSNGGTIVLGEKDNSKTQRVDAIAELFEESSQRFLIPKDIHHEKWWKFMLNTCFNTLSAILLADYAAISGNQDFIRAVRIVAKEVQSVAYYEGVLLTGNDVEEIIRRVARHTDHGQTSMLQDVLAHRNTENNYFAGAVSRLAQKHGLKTPICDFLQILLEAKRNVQNS